MRGFLSFLKWVVLFIVLLGGTWAAFNGPWADAPAQPRPAALTPAPLQVGEPSAFALLLAKTVRETLPTSAPLQCGVQGGDCTQAWLDQGEKLREQLASAGDFARVCEAATEEGASWVEPALKLDETNPAATPFPSFQRITACHRWLRAQATLAVLDRKDAQALQFLLRGDHMTRGMLEGAQSLIGHAVAWSLASKQWQTVATLAVARPQLAEPLLTLVRPLDPVAQSTQRWIATESAFSQAVMRDLRNSCTAVNAAPEAVTSWLDRLWCKARLGVLPELTAQQMDAHFLALYERTREGALQAAAHRPKDAAEPSNGASWAWRNTVGHILAETARPSWEQYIDRQAEAELGRQAAELVVRMTAEQVPAAGREAWLKAQALPPETAGRFSLNADQLRAQPWRAEPEAARALSFPLPKTSNP